MRQGLESRGESLSDGWETGIQGARQDDRNVEKRMRNAQFVPPSLRINALSLFTRPFLSLSLTLYSLCLNPSLPSSISLHIYIRSPPVHHLVSLDGFILSLATAAAARSLAQAQVTPRVSPESRSGHRPGRRGGGLGSLSEAFKTNGFCLLLVSSPPSPPAISFPHPQKSQASNSENQCQFHLKDYSKFP